MVLSFKKVSRRLNIYAWAKEPGRKFAEMENSGLG